MKALQAPICVEFDCERCKKDYAMYCVNGAIWLCWSCYCRFMKPSSEDSAS